MNPTDVPNGFQLAGEDVELPRREWIKGLAAGSLAAFTESAWSSQLAQAEQASSAGRGSVVQQENAKAGSNDWQLTRVRLDNRDHGRTSLIEGYCSRQSVAAGEKLDIMVSTNPPRPFRIESFGPVTTAAKGRGC